VFVVNLSLKLALLILTGFVAGKRKVLPPEAQKTLMGLVMNITLPCLIIGSFAVGSTGEELWKFGAMLLSAAAVLAASALLGHLVYILMGRSGEGAAAKVCITFANVTFFGIPVVEALYGTELLMYYNIFGTVVRVVNYSLIAPLLGGYRERRSVKEKLRDICSPPFIAVVIGLVLYFLHIPLPAPVSGAVNALGGVTSPLGMVVIGLILSEARFGEVLKKPMALLITALRLLGMPAAALGILVLLHAEKTVAIVVMLFISMPVASLLPSYIMRFRPDRDGELLAGLCVCLTSVLCIVTIPIWAYVLDWLY
jgi:predicted permease